MNFKFLHNNINVLDVEKSIEFYNKALGLKETSRIEMDEFTLVYLGDGQTPHLLELTELKGRKEPYDMGENNDHIAFEAADFAAAHKLHEEMGCICYENKEMGIYFIKDYDENWLEILPAKWTDGKDFIKWKEK
jgi:lactoylglutathione lyase